MTTTSGRHRRPEPAVLDPAAGRPAGHRDGRGSWPISTAVDTEVVELRDMPRTSPTTCSPGSPAPRLRAARTGRRRRRADRGVADLQRLLQRVVQVLLRRPGDRLAGRHAGADRRDRRDRAALAGARARATAAVLLPARRRRARPPCTPPPRTGAATPSWPTGSSRRGRRARRPAASPRSPDPPAEPAEVVALRAAAGRPGRSTMTRRRSRFATSRPRAATMPCLGGELVGLAAYHLEPSLIIFTHTEVEDAYEGQGVGSALARFALDEARTPGPAGGAALPVHPRLDRPAPGLRRPGGRSRRDRLRPGAAVRHVLDPEQRRPGGRSWGWPAGPSSADSTWSTFQDHPYQPRFLDTWTLLSYVAARPRRVTWHRTCSTCPFGRRRGGSRGGQPRPAQRGAGSSWASAPGPSGRPSWPWAALAARPARR